MRIPFMSCFPRKKKHLLPSSNKAWRSFTSKLQSKFQKLKKSKFIQKATTNLNSSYQNQNNRKFHARKLWHQPSFAPIYVDELFQQPVPMVVEHVEPKIELKKGGAKSLMNYNGAAAACSSSSSYNYHSMMANRELGEVDVRAEMFIAKFKEDMRLQRQRSLEKYREMLARGV